MWTSFALFVETRKKLNIPIFGGRGGHITISHFLHKNWGSISCEKESGVRQFCNREKSANSWQNILHCWQREGGPHHPWHFCNVFKQENAAQAANSLSLHSAFLTVTILPVSFILFCLSLSLHSACLTVSILPVLLFTICQKTEMSPCLTITIILNKLHLYFICIQCQSNVWSL